MGAGGMFYILSVEPEATLICWQEGNLAGEIREKISRSLSEQLSREIGL